MKALLAAIFIVLAWINTSASTPDWLIKARQIKVLSSTKDDLYKILGKPKSDDLPHLFIQKGSDFLIVYSDCEDCKCGTQWKVPKWTVIEFIVSLDVPIRPRSVGIRNFKGFRSYKEHDTPNIIYYNDRLGIKYVTLFGKITELIYYPPAKLNYLICAKSSYGLLAISSSSKIFTSDSNRR